jgi:drug efflux transport system permease protein
VDKKINLRRTAAVARKESIQILRDLRSLLIVISMPAMLMLLMGYGISLDQKHVPVCFFDRNASQESRDLLNRFRSSPYFGFVTAAPSFAALGSDIDRGRCSLGLVIPNDFAQRMREGGTVAVEGIVDGTDDNTANVVFTYAESVLAAFSQSVQLHYLEQAGFHGTTGVLALEPRVWSNESLESRNYIVPGIVALVMALIGAFLASLTIAREWERGTMEQLISTPVKPLEVTLGKLLPYFAIGVGDTAICILITMFWFRVPMRGSWPALVLASMLFLLTVLMLGFWISAATRSQLLASQFSLLATLLPSFLLSGFGFPLGQTPVVVRAMSYLVPARYYVSLLKNIFLKGAGTASQWPLLLALGLFAGLISFAAMGSFRKTLQ